MLAVTCGVLAELPVLKYTPGGAIGRRGVADHIGVAGVGDEGWQQG